jgi:hypothetical protein
MPTPAQPVSHLTQKLSITNASVQLHSTSPIKEPANPVLTVAKTVHHQRITATAVQSLCYSKEIPVKLTAIMDTQLWDPLVSDVPLDAFNALKT